MHSVWREIFSLGDDAALRRFAVLFGVANLDRPIGEAGLPLDVFRGSEGRHVGKTFYVPLASPHAQENEVFLLVGLELVLHVLRYHYPFMLSDDRRSSILEGEGRLALQNDKDVILATVRVQRVLAAAGIDLDRGPQILSRRERSVRGTLLE